MNTKVLLDSLIVEKADGTIVVGRGVPLTWNEAGEVIEVSNFLCENGKRIGFTIKSDEGSITFSLTGDKLEKSDVSLELPILKDNIKSVTSSCSFDSTGGTVIIPAGVREAVITPGK